METKGNRNFSNKIPFLTCAFVVAIASIVYELIIGGISSYLLGNSVYQFSITIGLFMTSMGLGSLFSKYIEEDLIFKFMLIEVALALIGGSCGLILFYSYAVLNSYLPIMFLLTVIIGTLTGFELPLVTRIVGSFNQLKDALANATAADYIGGLIGSIAFPILLLPRLGFIKTSYIIGILNIIVAAYLFIKYKGNLRKNKMIFIVIMLVIVILMIGVFTVDDTEAFLERKLYRDKVVFSSQTEYQKIVITEDRDDIRLFLNGNIQFSSKDEYRYHESLVHPALSLLDGDKKILILGGGDGLAIREVLKYSDIQEIDLVDLDKSVTDLAKTSEYLLKFNQDSFSDKRVKIINQDAYQYLETSKKKYDVILVDLPDPNNESLNKLYTVTFYRFVYEHLNDQGIMAAQSTSPYFAAECFWIIHNTIKEAGFYTSPYHVYIPSFGDWGFNIGTKGFRFNPADIKIKVATKFLTDQQAENLFVFGQDILNEKTADINTLIRPILIRTYYNAWEEYN
ncbi:polyamine aminopropyltransferase [Halocella sp. SP3-1]|uniref:polyamine aminopropyltransferase n=1 Tax=Halocella sp. SP3-1 TaxID=2382161 RepID=UPI000F75FEA3|nr:polyamine aminopropyltransferase [Halocella sp. SP3-1]AZO93539.1 polyamine aminopropyltransferase [Halocella sp. SP3-1]